MYGALLQSVVTLLHYVATAKRQQTDDMMVGECGGAVTSPLSRCYLFRQDQRHIIRPIYPLGDIIGCPSTSTSGNPNALLTHGNIQIWSNDSDTIHYHITVAIPVPQGAETGCGYKGIPRTQRVLTLSTNCDPFSRIESHTSQASPPKQTLCVDGKRQNQRTDTLPYLSESGRSLAFMWLCKVC